jgi:hypothetical protein
VISDEIAVGKLGFIILYVAGFGFYSLFTRRWSDLFVLALIGAGVFILMFVLSFIQETCNTLIEKIRML